MLADAANDATTARRRRALAASLITFLTEHTVQLNPLAFTRVALGYPEPGTHASGVACVRAKTEKTASTGSPYLVVTLGHREGSATVKVW